jgi:peptide-methionine (R)-S-oxide reductase
MDRMTTSLQPVRLSRRTFVTGAAAIGVVACGAAPAGSTEGQIMADTSDDNIDWANLTEAQWRERLTEEEFRILRKEGTERAGTSPLNEEKREGTYVCAGCALPLFSSETKFESGTGWPSFYDTLPGAVETKTDFKLIYPRTEYHCARCGGHQGHVFKDGPQPTGLRYCNNGVALDFVPKAS